MKTFKDKLFRIGNNKSTYIAVIAFLIIFIYFAVFRYFVIPSGDDYFWLGPQGYYLMHHGFYGPTSVYGGSSNGRYLGNLLEIFTMRKVLIAVLAFAFFWTLLVWCIWKLSNKRFISLVMASLFIFTLHDAFVNNILVWNAGFVNYVPPIALVLTYLVVVFDGEKKSMNKLIPWITLMLGFCAGFFLETMTVMQVLLGIIVVAYYFFKKNLKSYHITYLVGAILSAIIMGMHPAYHENSDYRHTTYDLTQIWANYSKYTHFWLTTFNTILFIAIILSVLVIAFKSNRNSLIRYSVMLISTIFLAYYIGIRFYLKRFHTDYNYMFFDITPKAASIDGVVAILFIIFIGICIFLFFKKNLFIWLYYIFAGISYAPLLVVTSPISCRGVFISYVFMYLIGMQFVLTALEKINFNVNILAVILLFITVFMAGNYQYKMHANYVANLERVQDKDFLDGKKLLTKHVPYRKFSFSKDLLDQQSASYWKDKLNK